MKSNQLISAFLFLLLIIGCNNTTREQTNYNFKNYFFQPEWFDEVKVYEYEINTGKDNYFIYREFERVGKNKLKSTIYDKDLNKSIILLYKHLPHRILISDIYTIEIWNRNKVSKELIVDSTVFEYHSMNKEFGFSNSSRMEGESDIMEFVTRTIIREIETDYQGKKVNAIFVNGQTKMVIKNSETYPEGFTITDSDKLMYVENIGVVHLESKNRYNEATINLTRIISLNEFEEMKKNADKSKSNPILN